jgi:hypothetical protein
MYAISDTFFKANIVLNLPGIQFLEKMTKLNCSFSLLFVRQNYIIFYNINREKDANTLPKYL